MKRRRIIYGGGSSWNPIYIDGYVQDGLVFHLDGINTGSDTANQWIDLIGGTSFNLVENCAKAANYVNFPGSGWSYAIADKTCLDDLDLTNCTIEVVYKVDGFSNSARKHSPIFFAGFATDSLDSHIGLLAQHYNYHQFSFVPSSVQNKRWLLQPTDIDVNNDVIRASLSPTIGFINGITAQPTGNIVNVHHNQNATVGAILDYSEKGGDWKYRDVFIGKIYSIRVYNRCLTQNEISQNVNRDNVRFGFVTTIGDR